jgi:hypothetical protein
LIAAGRAAGQGIGADGADAATPRAQTPPRQPSYTRHTYLNARHMYQLAASKIRYLTASLRVPATGIGIATRCVGGIRNKGPIVRKVVVVTEAAQGTEALFEMRCASSEDGGSRP